MPEPITTTIAIILGKYALDKAGEFGKEIGPKALEAGKEMFTTVVDYFKGKEDKAYVAGALENNPEAAKSLVESELKKAAGSDPDFIKKLEAILARYNEAVEAHQTKGGRISVKGGGAVSTGSGDALGKGAVKAEKDVGGSIITGTVTTSGQAMPHDPIPPLRTAPAGLVRKLVTHFDDNELRQLCHDMNIDYEQLRGQDKQAKARALVQLCERTLRIPALIDLCEESRPRIGWR
jgi:hypothetical protein